MSIQILILNVYSHEYLLGKGIASINPRDGYEEVFKHESPVFGWFSLNEIACIPLVSYP